MGTRGGFNTEEVWVREEKQGLFVCLSCIREEELVKEEKYRAEFYLQRCVPVTGTWHL